MTGTCPLDNYYNTMYVKCALEAEMRRRDRLKFLFSERPVGLRILALGCGPGVDVAFLVSSNEVHGIDIADEALKLASQRGIIPYRLDLSSLRRFRFAQNFSYVVLASDILEHLLMPQSLLTEARRMPKPGGFPFMSVPNHFYWMMRLRILRGKGMVLPFHGYCTQWDYFHIRFFTSQGFEQLLRATGYRISKTYYDQFISVPRAFPRSVGTELAASCPDLFSMHSIAKAEKA